MSTIELNEECNRLFRTRLPQKYFQKGACLKKVNYNGRRLIQSQGLSRPKLYDTIYLRGCKLDLDKNTTYSLQTHQNQKVHV